MWKVPVLFLALATSSILGKDVDGGINIADNIVDDKKIEELLLKENLDADFVAFIEDHIKKGNMIWTKEEAITVATKIRNRDLMDKTALQDNMRKILEIGNLFKEKLEKCKYTQGKTVDSFVRKDLAVDIKKRLLLLFDTFKCADDDKSVATESVFFKKEFPFSWDDVETLRTMLTSNPEQIMTKITKFFTDLGWLSKEIMPTFTLIGGEIVKNPNVIDFFLTSIDQLEMFMKTESGKRMMNIIPSIWTAEPEDALEIFTKEADYNQEVFFNLLKNDDLYNHFMKQVAKVVLTIVQWGKTALDDPMRFAVVNGVLISNDFPPINKKNLLKSTCGIIEKCLQLFTTIQLDFNIYDEIKVVANEFEKIYFKFDDFGRFSEDELVNVLSKFLSDNILTQMRDGYLANRIVTMKNKHCAPKSICLLNEKYAKSNLIAKNLVKGMSVTLVYAWDYMFEDLPYNQNYEAILKGIASSEEASCQTAYPDAPEECDVFQNTGVAPGMNLGYDHNEL